MSLKSFTSLTRRRHKEAILKCIQAFVNQNADSGRSPRLYDQATLTDPQLLDLERQQFNKLPTTLEVTPSQPTTYAPQWYVDLRWALGNLYASYGYGLDDGLRKAYTNDHVFQWWMVNVRKGRPPTQEGFPMTFEDFITLMHATADEDEQTQAGISVAGWVDPATLNVVEIYIQYVVEYANTMRVQGMAQPPKLPLLKDLLPSKSPGASITLIQSNIPALEPGPIVAIDGSTNPLKRPLSPSILSRLSGRESRPFITEENKPVYTSESCMYISNAEFRRLQATPDADRNATIASIYQKAGIDVTKFWKLDYLFIPYETKGRDHISLMGFAPKQKFCFIIDSYQPAGANRYYKTASPHRELYAMLLHFAPNAGSRPERWDIWVHWAARNTDSTADGDTGPNAPRQADGWNCGIHAATNALNLAFGYRLMCYSSQDLDHAKRPRMTAEILNGGFEGEYRYDIAALPTFTRMTDEEEDALFQLVKPPGYSEDLDSDPEDKTAESEDSSDDDDDFDMDGYGDDIGGDRKKKDEDKDDKGNGGGGEDSEMPDRPWDYDGGEDDDMEDDQDDSEEDEIPPYDLTQYEDSRDARTANQSILTHNSAHYTSSTIRAPLVKTSTNLPPSKIPPSTPSPPTPRPTAKLPSPPKTPETAHPPSTPASNPTSTKTTNQYVLDSLIFDPKAPFPFKTPRGTRSSTIVPPQFRYVSSPGSASDTSVYIRRYGFMYYTPSLSFPFSWEDATAEDLSALSVKFLLRGYKSVRDSELGVFKRWVQSELGAYADLLEGSKDGVRPMRGVKKGFEKWKKSVEL